jgi:hypothetical protein
MLALLWAAHIEVIVEVACPVRDSGPVRRPACPVVDCDGNITRPATGWQQVYSPFFRKAKVANAVC